MSTCDPSTGDGRRRNHSFQDIHRTGAILLVGKQFERMETLKKDFFLLLHTRNTHFNPKRSNEHCQAARKPDRPIRKHPGRAVRALERR